MKLLIGRKLGMSQLFEKDGTVVPVTVLEVGPCPVVLVRDEKSDGYRAAQIGFGVRRAVRVKKPLAGHCKKAGVESCQFLRESPLAEGEAPKPGDRITVGQVFSVGAYVDVVGTSIGKGFAGTVKRYHFNRGHVTHGSKNTREPGSVGQHTWPGHVFKGKRMPGHLGNRRVTVKNLKVVEVDVERHRLLLLGAVPGKSGAIVTVSHAKTARRPKTAGKSE